MSALPPPGCSEERTVHDGVLPGGNIGAPRRDGETVIRAGGQGSNFSRRLLRFFADRQWNGAPRLRSVDARGVETLDFIEGEVPWPHPVPDWAVTDDALRDLARLTRAFHDLAAGSDLVAGAQTVCHNDLSPSNTVYAGSTDGARPIAFIDWDAAAPGPRLDDVAHLAWQWLELGPGISDVSEAARRLRILATAYGPEIERPALVARIHWWQERTWRGIQAQAADDDPARRRLVERGVAQGIRAAAAWTAAHAAELTKDS
ncbi:MAG: phosphotransferase [bacterium]